MNKKSIIFTICVLIFCLIFLITKLNRPDNFTQNKKIALCFLIYDKINHEDIWYKFLKNVDKNKYNIYIHYKENKPLKYFEQYKLKNTVETSWCGDSLVKAQNILLKKAVKDKENQHFIFVSNSCIPIKTFNHIYAKLNPNFSYFNMSTPQTDKFRYMKAYKASQWCILNRKHTKQILKNEKKLNDIFQKFKQKHIRGCPDEYSYITLLHHLNEKNNLILTENLSADAVTFTGWDDMQNYKRFDKSKLSKSSPNSYTYICPEELNYLLNSKSLFGRKFEENCGGLENIYKSIV